MTRTIKRGGIFATVAGDGPPLLVIHGLGNSRNARKSYLDQLSETFTIVVVDLLGHGDSDWLDPEPEVFTPAEHAQALKPMIDEFAPMHVVGSSLGGWTGLEIAANGWAKSLTVLCPAGIRKEALNERFAALDSQRKLAGVLGPVLPPTIGLLSRAPMLGPALFGESTANFAELDKSLLVTSAKSMQKSRGFYASHEGLLHHVFDRASEIPESVPVTVVLGEQDQLVPPALQDRSAVPSHAEWIVFQNCGHMPAWDQQQRTVETIRETAARAK